MVLSVLLTIINCVSAKWATQIAESFTALKLVAIGFLVLLGASWVGKGMAYSISGNEIPSYIFLLQDIYEQYSHTICCRLIIKTLL